MATPSLTPEGKINPDYINIAVEFMLYRLQKMIIIPTQITKKPPIYDTYYWIEFPARDAKPSWIAYWDAYYTPITLLVLSGCSPSLGLVLL